LLALLIGLGGRERKGGGGGVAKAATEPTVMWLPEAVR